MQLNVRETAELLDISENTILNWIKTRNLPTSKIKGQYRFNHEELLEWATTQRADVPPTAFARLAKLGEAPDPSLADALRAGGVYYEIEANSREGVIKAVIELTPFSRDMDKDYLLHMILARESLDSTGIGGGIAIPHVRSPIVLNIPHAIIVLCFLKQAIEFGALDGKPVHTLFTLFCPTISAHLHVLSRLALALRHFEFAGVIARRGSPEEIFATAALVDRSVPMTAESPQGVQP